MIQIRMTVIDIFLMICINPKRNPKLLETFNNDPYADLTIRTSASQIHLVLGYLSIDSQFFEEVEPNGGVIQFLDVPQGPLIKILRALYGEQLYAYNVKQLEELFSIIEQLKIHQYKENIVKYIMKNPQLMDKFELIEFCFKHGMLEKEIRERHYNSKLSVFASTKNYLQLNKISQSTLNSMLIQYSAIKGEEGDSTINSIIENYIGRNDLRPNDYFLQPGLEPLQIIWEKYHHSINYLISAQEKVRQSQILSNEDVKKSMMIGTNSQFSHPVPTLVSASSIPMAYSIGLEPVNNKSSSFGNPSPTSSSSFVTEMQEKESKIVELEKTFSLNRQIIEMLKMEIENARKDKGARRSHDSDEEHADFRRTNKSYDDIGDGGGEDYDVSLIEPPLNQARKIVNEEAKEVKTMNKLNTRAKKIFN